MGCRVAEKILYTYVSYTIRTPITSGDFCTDFAAMRSRHTPCAVRARAGREALGERGKRLVNASSIIAHHLSLLLRKDYRGCARATSGRPCSPCSLPAEGRGPEDLLGHAVVASTMCKHLPNPLSRRGTGPQNAMRVQTLPHPGPFPGGEGERSRGGGGRARLATSRGGLFAPAAVEPPVLFRGPADERLEMPRVPLC
jgi:hypothetical protein